MRFTVSSAALSCRLEALSSVISRKTNLPIMGDIVPDIEKDVM